MEVDKGTLAGIVAGASLITGTIGWFVKGYSGKKAENIATKEDIGEITTIQKTVESEIAEGAWRRQQQWTKEEGLYGSAFDNVNRAFLEIYKLMDLNSKVKGRIMLKDAEGQRQLLAEMDAGRVRLTDLLTSLRTIHSTLALHTQSNAVAALVPLIQSLGALSNPVPFENRLEAKVLYEAEKFRDEFQELATVDFQNKFGNKGSS